MDIATQLAALFTRQAISAGRRGITRRKLLKALVDRDHPLRTTAICNGLWRRTTRFLCVSAS
jgi:hypothetical protein